MQFLKRAAFAGLALASFAGAGPASAQYFPRDNPPFFPGGNPGYEPDEYSPPRRYRREPRYERPYYQPRARLGYTCATSRGSCELDDGRPVSTICKCYLPGFGPKRGYVQ